MSRVGRKPIEVPKNVKLVLEHNAVNVEGPKGKLSFPLTLRTKAALKDGVLSFERVSDMKTDKALQGTARSVVFNMIKGVTDGFVKELLIEGVGFKAQVQGKVLNLQLSYTHPINYNIPEGIMVETPKANLITVKGIDKMKVGEVAAEIREFYRPEPYKGKGIKYVGEYVRRKAGKAVAGAGAPGA